MWFSTNMCWCCVPADEGAARSLPPPPAPPPAAFFIGPDSQPIGTNDLRLFHHHVTVVSMTVTTVLWAAALETLVRRAHADSLARVSNKCSYFGACNFSKGKVMEQKVLPVSLTPQILFANVLRSKRVKDTFLVLVTCWQRINQSEVLLSETICWHSEICRECNLSTGWDIIHNQVAVVCDYGHGVKLKCCRFREGLFFSHSFSNCYL